tara:strand:- start:4262 stop:4738 length:477 start_codon:yes stop_codon:yes gene_type:complete
VIINTLGFVYSLTLRATNKDLKVGIDETLLMIRRKPAKWSSQKLRKQNPWDYLKSEDSIPQEFIDNINNPSRPLGLIRQNADYTEYLDLMNKLKKWEVTYQNGEPVHNDIMSVQDYYFAENKNQPHNSKKKYKELKMFVGIEAAKVAQDERLFKQVNI